MALSGTVWGTFSGRTTAQARPRISWSATQSIAGNYSDVTATLYYENYGPYYAYNFTNTTNFKINGDSSTATKSWDLRNPPVTVAVWTRTVRVNHNSDGTKTFNLYAYADTSTSFGIMNVDGNQTLDTIPRQASITSSVSFKAGNSIPLTFNNPANGYLKVRVYVHDGTDYEPYIKDQNMGAVSSGTVTFTQAQIDDIYTQLGSSSSKTVLIRTWTYSDSGYSNQIGSYSDKTGTCTKPSRATVTSSADLTIGNNRTFTLSNPDSKYVKMRYYINGNAGWYIVKDQNNGTGTSGTFTMSETDNNNMYSRMPNATSVSAIVRAYTYAHSDYTTQIGDYHDVNGTVSIDQATNKPDFSTFTVSNLDKTINNTDKYSNILATNSTSTLLGADTRMIKGHSKLRAVVTSANKMVAKNYATAIKYRFVSGSKNKEENYSADSTVNLDIDNAENSTVSVTAYDSRSLTTTVTDSTSITNNAEYEAVSLWGMSLTRDNGVDAPTKLAFSGSYWNEYFGGGTDGVQNTITAHYRYKESTASWGTQTWNSITVTDTDGSLSFDDYINGDLGAGGFDSEKSFDIEVRAYDKLTNTIIEQTLSVGTPVMDITQDGIAIGDRYDATEGGKLQLLGKNILDIIYPIGHIYTTTENSNPNTLFGFGTWSAVGEGKMLVGKASSGTFATAGTTGGSETASLEAGNIPSHRHSVSITSGTISANHTHKFGFVTGPNTATGSPYATDREMGYNPANQYVSTGTVSANHTHSVSGNTGYYGSGSGFDIMNPYLVVYMWERTA